MPLERGETQNWLRPGGPTCLRPNSTSHHTKPHQNTLHYINEHFEPHGKDIVNPIPFFS
uniref:Uncharacterized protein n=1 Tax=Mesocestoides corti TaxID=53468 RepID=A0A5K3EP01_MESCO